MSAVVPKALREAAQPDEGIFLGDAQIGCVIHTSLHKLDGYNVFICIGMDDPMNDPSERMQCSVLHDAVAACVDHWFSDLEKR